MRNQNDSGYRFAFSAPRSVSIPSESWGPFQRRFPLSAGCCGFAVSGMGPKSSLGQRVDAVLRFQLK